MASAKAIATAIVVIIIIIGVAAYVATRGKAPATTTPATTSPPTASPKTTQSPTTTTTSPPAATAKLTYIKIGALLPLSGDLASFGKANKEAVKLAEEDFNKYLESKGLIGGLRSK